MPGFRHGGEPACPSPPISLAAHSALARASAPAPAAALVVPAPKRTNPSPHLVTQGLQLEDLCRRENLEQSSLLLFEERALLPPELDHPRKQPSGLVVVVTGFEHQRFYAPPSRHLRPSEVPSTPVELNAGDMLGSEKQFRGSIGGSCSPDRDFPTFLQWFATGDLDLNAMVTERYTIDQINEATTALEEGKISGRSILVFED